MRGNAAFLKGPAEKLCHIVLHAHGSKDNCKLLVRVISQRCLLHDLRRQLIMRKSVSGKDRQLLSPDQGHQTVNGRNSGTDIISRIFTGHRV